MSRSIAELSSAFTKGLQVQFDRYYDIATREADPRLGMICRQGLTSDGQSEKYHIWNAAPRLARWREGFGIPSKGFEGVQFEVENIEFGREIVMHKNAIADDRTRMAFDWARRVAQDRPKLIERLVFQILKGGTDTDGLDTIPNAADGQALFATVGADGNPRWGATNGNLLPASGTSVQNRRDDYYAMIEQWLLLQDTEGRQLITEQEIDKSGVILMFAAGQLENMEQAFVQKAGTVSTDNSAPTNVIVDGNRRLILWPTQFLTGTAFYGALNIEEKGIFIQDREPMQSETADGTNSDRTRTKGEVAFSVHTRLGAGVTHPFALMKSA